MKGARVSVEEAAVVLGMSPNRIRSDMQAGRLSDIGEAVVKGTRADGRPSYRYYIYAPRVLARVGLTEWPEIKKGE